MGEQGHCEEDDVGVRVVMMSQILVACLQSERVLRRRQSSCSETGALCCLAGVVVVAV